MRLYFVVVLFVVSQYSFGQSIQGTVRDKETQEPVVGATVIIANSAIGTVTNKSGVFILEGLGSDSLNLRISSVGYATVEQRFAANNELQIELSPVAILLNNEVTVTAQRTERRAFDVAPATTILSTANLEQKSARSTPEALMNETGVWVQKTNHGGGAPIIRGLVGNQVLLMIDGIRLNNATYRYGPNQYLSTIDPDLISRMEVIRGSGSVLYGSDALGGVVHILSKTPSFSSDGFKVSGNATGKWMSAGMEQSLHTGIELANKKVAFIGGFSSRNFGNILAGGDLGTLNPSGYQERSGDAKVLIRTGNTGLLTGAFQQSTQHNVSRYDQVVLGGYSLFSFEPQTRQLSYLRWETTTPNKWVKSFRITTSLNNSIEGTLSQKNNSADLKKQRDEVTTTGLIAEVNSSPAPNWQAQTGIEYYFDKVKSESMVLNTTTDAEKSERGSYADGSSFSNGAVYTNHQIDLKNVQLLAGTRFNIVQVSVVDNIFGNQEINPNAWVANAGAVYKINSNLRLIGGVNTGFRSPNVDDMSKFGTVESGVFEIPSSALSPEKSFTMESGLKFSGKQLSWTLTAYRTKLTDLIDRVAATYNGSDVAEGRKVFQKQNVGEALVRGIEADVESAVTRSFTLSGNLTFTHGENITKNEPMRRIPPLFGRLGVKYTYKTSLWVKGEWAMAADQSRLAAGDKSDVRIKSRLVDSVMPGWDIVNVYMGYSFSNISLNITAQNLFDKAYRVYASGVDGYGRSMTASVKIAF
jgi:hemoglobin/transferrin/lactoferrin receptor protein